MGGKGRGRGKGGGGKGRGRGRGKGKGGGGKHGSKGGGGGKGGGGFRNGPPRRGGGESGKRQRQQAQENQRNAKIEKEVDYFFACQQQACAGHTPSPENAGSLFQTAGAAGINFDKYDELEVERSGRGAKDVPALESFADIANSGGDIPPFVLENITRCNYTKPTPIQKHSIPFSLQGRDVMCCAQTGSGKTAAFLLPVVAALGQAEPSQVVPGEAANPQMVVLAPTRELATQIFLEARKFCFGSSLRAIQVYGGAEVKPQMKELAFGVDLLVATPGKHGI